MVQRSCVHVASTVLCCENRSVYSCYTQMDMCSSLEYHVYSVLVICVHVQSVYSSLYLLAVKSLCLPSAVH